MSPSRLEHALLHHLAPLQGLRGVQVFVGQDGEWREAARFGENVEGAPQRILPKFDPDASGAVEGLGGKTGGWLASYMTAGPALDMVLVLHLANLTPADLQQRLAQIEARVGWLLVAALRDQAASIADGARGSEIGGAILMDAAQARSRGQLADQWIARIQSSLNPDLTAVLWVQMDTPQLAATSGTGAIEKRSDARTAIEVIAAEALRKRAPLVLAAGAPADSLGDTARGALSRLGADRALVLPVDEGDDIGAVVVALFDETSPPIRVDLGDTLSSLLAESMVIQRRAHPAPLRRAWNWIAGVLLAVFGKTAFKLKLTLVGLLVLLALAAVLPTRMQPGFSARIDAADRRIISAPFDGFVSAASFQPGDRVARGDLLVAFEDSELRLQQAQNASELAEIDSRLQTARAQRDSAQVRELEARRAQSVVTQDLLTWQVEQAKKYSASDALVVGGDAWRRVGDRVRLGEPLVELASVDSYRVRALVDEDWVTDIGPDARGHLLLTAYPRVEIPVRISARGAEPEDDGGVNAFPVWLDIVGTPPAAIMDGMRGVVRIDVGQRSLLQAYGRGLYRWAQRMLWRWG